MSKLGCLPNTHSAHQLAIRTPGIFPWSANLRKQIRHKPNLRYTARGRPHRLQRDSARVLNFGGRLALAILDLLATGFLSLHGVKHLLRGRTFTLERQSQALQQFPRLVVRVRGTH